MGGSRYGREWMGGLVSTPEGRQCAKSVVAVLLDAILWVGLLRREGETVWANVLFDRRYGMRASPVTLLRFVTGAIHVTST